MICTVEVLWPFIKSLLNFLIMVALRAVVRARAASIEQTEIVQDDTKIPKLKGEYSNMWAE